MLIGAGFVANAVEQASPVVSTTGQEDSYAEVTRGGVYEQNELRLAGDSNTYYLNKNSFHPQLPDKLYHGGTVRIWVHSGSTRVLAIELRDGNDSSPTRYTTDEFDRAVGPGRH